MEGRQVGSYIIEHKLGEGGMGVVYAARHVRMTGRAVVKMLHQRYAADPKITRRFENEANAAASIGHPGIVQVFDIGQVEDGSLYIAMELLEGESLQQRLNRMGRLPVPHAVSIVRQAVSALAAAHAAGIVHRDLKPDNLFLVQDPDMTGGERVKLLDFGIAKLADESPEGMRTGTGTVMGTPHYMSPEQCRGAGEVDHRSDLYSIGCILFALVTGRTPFVGTGAGDYVAAHLTAAPPLLRSLCPEAPEYLEELVSVLLAKDPNERFGSAEALMRALDGLSSSAQASAQSQAPEQTRLGSQSDTSSSQPSGPPTTFTAGSGQGPQLSSPSQAEESKSRRWGALALTGLLIVGAGAGGYLYKERSGSDAGSVPADAAVVLADQVDASQAPVLDEPALALKAMELYHSPKGSSISNFNSRSWWETVAADFEHAVKQADAPSRWQAGAHLARGFIALLDGKPEEALALFEQARDEDASWPIARVTVSIALTRLGRFDDAMASTRDAQRLDPDWAGAVAAAARVLVASNKLDEAIHEYQRALELAPKDPNLMSELALVYHAARLDPEAERYAREALALDPDLVSVRILLAERALEDKDGKTAVAEAARALAVSPKSLAAQLAYADALVMLGEKDEALAAYAKAIATYDEKKDQSSAKHERIESIRKRVEKGKLPRRGTERSKRPRSPRTERPADNSGGPRSPRCDPFDPLCGF